MAAANTPDIDPQIEKLCDDFRRDYKAVQAEIRALHFDSNQNF